MDVQAAENWADIKGTIIAIEPQGEMENHMAVTIKVEEVTPVEGYRNMFSWAVGKEIVVNVRTGEVTNLAPGDRFTVRVKKAGPLRSVAAPNSIAKSAD